MQLEGSERKKDWGFPAGTVIFTKDVLALNSNTYLKMLQWGLIRIRSRKSLVWCWAHTSHCTIADCESLTSLVAQG